VPKSGVGPLSAGMPGAVSRPISTFAVPSGLWSVACKSSVWPTFRELSWQPSSHLSRISTASSCSLWEAPKSDTRLSLSNLSGLMSSRPRGIPTTPSCLWEAVYPCGCSANVSLFVGTDVVLFGLYFRHGLMPVVSSP